MTVVPRWEWRAFGDGFGAAERHLAARTPERVDDSDDLYLLSPAGDASVKVRAGLMDVKRLVQASAEGLEQWQPVLKAAFPLAPEDARLVLETLDPGAPAAAHAAGTPGELVAASPGAVAVGVHKHRVHYRIDGCLAELSDLRAGEAATRTLAIESEDPARLLAVLRDLGLRPRENVSMARGIKALAGVAAPRCAVIDVGTNSVKFHIGERGAGGAWRTLADRAEVTRLGEGLDRTGRLGEEPIARTVEAIAGMAAEAQRQGVAATVAVGTAGLRIAPNAAALVDAVRERCGVEVQVIPAEEEARLAYLAATAELDTGAGSLLVFDTGGGSSQFTFGHTGEVDERFSVDVGAARFTERYGLDHAVSAATLAEARASIAAGLARLDGRPVPAAIVGMGGAVTNLAAVRHGLGAYDPDVVHGTVLDRGEIERQIELYRARSAAERREIAGLQPNRAEVILAGACIVATVLAALGGAALTVSDRGLRHGLLVERFGALG